MGSPPQGYVAGSVVTGNGTNNYVVRLDSSGKLGFFLNGTEVLFLDNLAAPNVRLQAAQASGTLYLDAGTLGAITLASSNADKVVMSNAGDLEYKANIFQAAASLFRNIATASGGNGFAPIMGLDNRTGLVAADGAPITLVTVPGTGLQLYRITADIFATAVSAGTANYTIAWTENAQAKTMAVAASVVNTLGTATDLINPDLGTTITAQLTFAGFTGTVKVAGAAEWFAGN